MNRRDFLERGALALGGVSPLSGALGALIRSPSYLDGDSLPSECELKVTEGKLPGDLRGTLLINTAKRSHERSSVINGTGEVFRFRFDGECVHAKTALMKTPSYYAKKEFSSSIFGFYLNHGIITLSPLLGVDNQLNTAFLKAGRHLLVTYEGGRHWLLDPDTLHAYSPLGEMQEWNHQGPLVARIASTETFPSIQTTAHPAYDDVTDEIFSIEFSISKYGAFCNLMCWDGERKLNKTLIKLPSGKNLRILQSAHQIGLTQHYVVIADTSMKVEQEQVFFGQVSRPVARGTQIYLVKREDLERKEAMAVPVQIDDEMVHFLLDYHHEPETLKMHYVDMSGSDASEWVRGNDRSHHTRERLKHLWGMITAPVDLSPTVTCWFGESGVKKAVKKMNMDVHWHTAFYTHTSSAKNHKELYWNSFGFDPELLTRRVVRLYGDREGRNVALQDLPEGIRPGYIFRIDTDTQDILDSYQFPAGLFNSSPQIVGEKYLASVVLGTSDEVWIFDRMNLRKGPVCKLGHEILNLPFTIHTQWLEPEYHVDRRYQVDVAADFEAQLRRLPRKTKQRFRRQILSKF